MPSPTSQAIEAIVERLKQACTDGTREPTAVLTADEHRALLDLHVHDPMAAGVVLQHIREHARTLENWTEQQVRTISFSIYVAGARRHIQEQSQIESSANVVRMAAQRNARVRRARTHDVSGPTEGELSPAQMLETDSPLLVAYGLLKQHRDGRIWHDEFYKAARTDWRGDDDGTVIAAHTITDEQVNRITRWLHTKDRRLNRMGIQSVNFVIDALANEDKRNEPRDWMRAQQWDGEPRLASLLTRGFGSPDTAFNREAGRCWFVSMAARVAEPGCKVDTMPVLIGPQGIRKSQALEVIGGDWYRAASSSVDSKDFLQEMHGVLVLEIPELHSMMSSRHGSTKVKAVLSTRIDHFRLPYGLRVGEHKRTCVLCGSTNNRDWHSDETGARRFWPIHCGHIDLEWLRAYRGQLFAEAMIYLDERREALALGPLAVGEAYATALHNGQWWNVPEAEQIELMDAETYVSPWQETVEAKLVDMSAYYIGLPSQRPTRWDGTANESTDWGNLLTVTRIGVQWLDMTREQLGRGSANGKTIAAIMRSLGWELKQVRVPGGSDRVKAFVLSLQRAYDIEAQRLTETGLWSAAHSGDTGDTEDNRSDTVNNRDDDIPF